MFNYNIGSITGMGPAYDAYMVHNYNNVEKVIKAFEVAIENGYHPNDVEQQIYRETGVNPNNLTFYDKQQIQHRVEEIYKSKNNYFIEE